MNIFSLLDSYVGNKLQSHDIWKTKPEELELLGQQGAEVMCEFAPVISSKYAKLAAFGFLAGGIYGTKYFATLDMIEKSFASNDNKTNAI